MTGHELGLRGGMKAAWPGHLVPLGATWDGEGTNFSLFSEGAERAAGGEMALDVEGVLDSGVNGQEALG